MDSVDFDIFASIFNIGNISGTIFEISLFIQFTCINVIMTKII